MARTALRSALGIALAASAALAHAEVVGRVLLAAGDATALREGKPVRLALNSPIDSKDVLRTGAASALQVRFNDEGMISLRENSEFAIEEYRFGGKEDGSERGFFRLVKGGFRAVTGAIGRTQKDNYKVRTQTATIGIRGTDYAVRDCRGDCGAAVKDGLYGTVLGLSSGTNKIALENNTGEHVFGISQSFYVPDANSQPQQLLQPPTFVSVKPQGKAQAAQQGGSGTGGEQSGGASGAAGESRPAGTTDVALTTPLITQPFQVTQTLTSAGTPAALPPANGFLAVYALPGLSLSDVVWNDDVSIASINGQNQLIGYGTPGTFPAGSLGGGTITDTGILTLPDGQTFVWGRWTGATQVTAANGQTFGNVPLLFGTASGLRQDNTFVGTVGGTGTYSYAGGPKPVDAGGNVGSVTSSSLTINFTQLTANYSLAMNFPSVLVSGSNMGSASFNVSGFAAKAGFGGEFDGSDNLSGTCSGGGCSSGSATGGFGVGLTGTQGYEFAVVTGAVSGTQAGPVVFLNGHTVNTFTPGPAPVGPLWAQIAWSEPVYAPASTWTISNGTTFNASNQPTAFTNPSCVAPANCLISAALTGAIVNPGSITLVDGGVMNWGRWSSAAFTDRFSGVVNMYSPPTGVPFVAGTQPGSTFPAGSFVYTLAGGTFASTAGASGTLTVGPTPGAFSIGFGSNMTISVVAPIQFTVAGAGTYSLNSLASIGGGSCSAGTCTGPLQNIPGMSFNATCSGGTCTSVSSVNATGTFFGKQAGGFGVSGNVFSNASGPPLPTVSFSGGFKR